MEACINCQYSKQKAQKNISCKLYGISVRPDACCKCYKLKTVDAILEEYNSEKELSDALQEQMKK